jgi:ABC-type transport system substrate-binding protein
VVAIPQTAPVPPGKDTGANYQLHPISTGPYKFASYQLGKQLTLVPNPYWSPGESHPRATGQGQAAGPAVWRPSAPILGVSPSRPLPGTASVRQRAPAL